MYIIELTLAAYNRNSVPISLFFSHLKQVHGWAAQGLCCHKVIKDRLSNFALCFLLNWLMISRLLESLLCPLKGGAEQGHECVIPLREE